MKRYGAIALAIGFAILGCGSGIAADDKALIRILTRACVAHNFALYCTQYDHSIIDRTKSAIGDMQQLMLHIRGEVVSGLPEFEASTVVVRSADAAARELCWWSGNYTGQIRSKNVRVYLSGAKSLPFPLFGNSSRRTTRIMPHLSKLSRE
jgi:hypothetical protein